MPFLHVTHFGPRIGTRRGETVVLCGCHRLDTIRSYYDVIGAEGRLVAIEANPANVDRLRLEIANDATLRCAGNIDLVSKGVWDKKGTATFIRSGGDYPGFDKLASDVLRAFPVTKVESTNTIEIEIEIDSLDNILLGLGIDHADYVVLTVNDAELPALDGIDRLLRRNPEVRLFINSQFPYPGEEVRRKLSGKGFRTGVAEIRRSGLHRIYAYRPAKAAAMVPEHV